MGEDLRFGRLTKEASKEKLGQAREAAAEYYEQGRQKMGRVGRQMEGYVREKPGRSMLVMAGAGLLLGYYLFGRRR